MTGNLCNTIVDWGCNVDFDNNAYATTGCQTKSISQTGSSHQPLHELTGDRQDEGSKDYLLKRNVPEHYLENYMDPEQIQIALEVSVEPGDNLNAVMTPE